MMLQWLRLAPICWDRQVQQDQPGTTRSARTNGTTKVRKDQRDPQGPQGFASDIRLKENIKHLRTIDGINQYCWNFINDPGTIHIGVIAQELIGNNV